MTEPNYRLLVKGGAYEMDEYEKRIREKVYPILDTAEWVYLVGLFQLAREHDERD